MPELPEVETVVRDLRPHLVGRRLASVRRGSRQSLRKPWRSSWNAEIAGRLVQSVSRRGKWIFIELDSRAVLVVHLGMTGQLTLVSCADPIADHTHLIFTLKDGPVELRFRDIRRFGSAVLFPSPSDVEVFFVQAKLGPEPFDLPVQYWREQLHGSKRCIKAVLLDQTVAAGVGNIYADESLFAARLHPSRRACDLSDAECDRLRKSVASVLRRAIERRGSSIRNYVGGSGLQGKYQNEFRAYGRTGEACPRCGHAIACLRLAGRSSHYCPICQTNLIAVNAAESVRRQRKRKGAT